MIKTEKGRTTINGTGAEILADISCIAEAVRRSVVKAGMEEKEAEEEIRNAVEDGFKSDEEIEDEIKEFMRKEFDKFCEEFMEKRYGGKKND